MREHKNIVSGAEAVDEELVSAFDDAVNDYYFSDFKNSAKKDYWKAKAALLERFSKYRRETARLMDEISRMMRERP